MKIHACARLGRKRGDPRGQLRHGGLILEGIECLQKLGADKRLHRAVLAALDDLCHDVILELSPLLHRELRPVLEHRLAHDNRGLELGRRELGAVHHRPRHLERIMR